MRGRERSARGQRSKQRSKSPIGFFEPAANFQSSAPVKFQPARFAHLPCMISGIRFEVCRRNPPSISLTISLQTAISRIEQARQIDLEHMVEQFAPPDMINARLPSDPPEAVAPRLEDAPAVANLSLAADDPSRIRDRVGITVPIDRQIPVIKLAPPLSRRTKPSLLRSTRRRRRARLRLSAPTSPRRTTILAGEIAYGAATDDFGARRTAQASVTRE